MRAFTIRGPLWSSSICLPLHQLVSTWTYNILIKGIISINYLTSTNDINQTKPFTSMTYDPTISQVIKPLASMTNHWHQWQHDPTIFPFGIDGNTNIDVNTNYQILMSTCRYDMFYINSQCDYLSTSISPINRHQSHQCDYLSPFDINGKGPFSSWGCSPYLNSPWGCSPYLNSFDIPLNNLSPFEQGISL
jgi:hypothetical protein